MIDLDTVLYMFYVSNFPTIRMIKFTDNSVLSRIANSDFVVIRIFCVLALATLKPQAGITAAPGATVTPIPQPVSTPVYNPYTAA